MWRSLFTVWSLRQFAFGLIAVYSPIFFYSLGKGMGFIFTFLAIQAFANGLMRLPYALYLSKRRKVKQAFIVSIVLASVIYALYAVFINNNSVLLGLAVADGILQAVLWSSYLYIFGAAQKHRDTGSQISVQYDGTYLSTIIAIAIGGFVAQYYGFIYNFFIATAALAFAAIVLTKMPITWPHHSKQIKYKKFNFKNSWYLSLAGSANAIDTSVVGVLWPLVFVVFGYLSYSHVGYVVALGLFIALFVNLVFGKISDDLDRAIYVLDGGIMATIFAYMLRVAYALSMPGAIVLSVVSQIFRGVVDVSYNVLFFRQLKKAKNKLHFIAEYESNSSYGLSLYFTLLGCLYLLGLSDRQLLIAAFLIAAMIMPLTRLIAQDRLEERN